jgi:CBS domain-containing protein
MRVAEGMNEIVVTVGPDHTLRDAARRMTAHKVGAAVVLDNEQAGPGIITERDLLRSSGTDQDLDAERVRDHLSPRMIYAYPDWSLEQAAEAMTKGAFRHVIVLGPSGEPVGILSMRDIVRCWIGDGASCDVPGETAVG